MPQATTHRRANGRVSPVDQAITPDRPPILPRDTYRAISSCCPKTDRKSTRLNSSHQIISYAVFCLKKKTSKITNSDLLADYRTKHRRRTLRPCFPSITSFATTSILQPRPNPFAAPPYQTVTRSVT